VQVRIYVFNYSTPHLYAPLPLFLSLLCVCVCGRHAKMAACISVSGQCIAYGCTCAMSLASSANWNFNWRKSNSIQRREAGPEKAKHPAGPYITFGGFLFFVGFGGFEDWRIAGPWRNPLREPDDSGKNKAFKKLLS